MITIAQSSARYNFHFEKKILENQNGLKRRKIDERQSEFWRSLEIPFNFMNYNNFKISRKAKQFTQVSINSKEFDWYVSKIPKWKCKYLKKGSLIDFFIIHFILPNTAVPRLTWWRFFLKYHVNRKSRYRSQYINKFLSQKDSYNVIFLCTKITL